MARTSNVKNLEECFLYMVENPYTGNGLINLLSMTYMTVNYDNETNPFTVGLVITGGTSGATGTIISIIDAGATGILTIDHTSGEFENNEEITDTSTGQADVNGVPDQQIVESTRWAEDVFTDADDEVIVRTVRAVEGTDADTVLTVAQEINYAGKAGGPYTADEVVTETTSGATGVVVADSNPAATGAGWLTLKTITGVFTGGEVLTGGDSGATSNGDTFYNRTATFSEGDPPDEAKSVTVSGAALSTILVTGGASGNVFEILRGIPTYGASDYILYATAKSHEEGDKTQPIRDKGVLQHRKYRHDVERKLSLSKLYVNDQEGFNALVGRDLIIIALRDDDRLGTTTEQHVFLQARINSSMLPDESEGDDISNVNINPRFERAYSMAG